MSTPLAEPSDRLGVYVHVPFCLRRCPYCAFYSLENQSEEMIHPYPEWILKEFELRAPQFQSQSLNSVYIGGGTPSLLKPAAIGQILQTMRDTFYCLEIPEVTLEANPGTIDVDNLSAFQAAGVNRISLGVQALDDHRLRFLGRIHSQAEAREAMRLVQEAGFAPWSVDLMAGTPSETIVSWDREIEELLAFKPDGISFYSLTVEEGTRLAQRFQAGEIVHLPQDETVDLLFHVADLLSQAGYQHYEVSNWALPGAECRHNLHYWQRGSYLGLGPSAHSFDGRERRWNTPDLKAYSEALLMGNQPPSNAERLTEEEIREEWVYLHLRQAGGLNLRDYAERFGSMPYHWKAMFDKIAIQGLGSFDGSDFQPNDRGLFLADEITARILG